MPALMTLIYSQPGLQTEIGLTQPPIIKYFMFALFHFTPYPL